MCARFVTWRGTAASLPAAGGGRGTGPCSSRRGRPSGEGIRSTLAPEEEDGKTLTIWDELDETQIAENYTHKHAPSIFQSKEAHLCHLENPCNGVGPGGGVDGPRPEPVGVVGPGRVVGLAADELGDEGSRRRRLLGAGAPAIVLLGGGAGAGRGVDEEEGVLGAEEEGRVVFRHSRPVGAVTEQQPLPSSGRRSSGGGGAEAMR